MLVCRGDSASRGGVCLWWGGQGLGLPEGDGGVSSLLGVGVLETRALQDGRGGWDCLGNGQRGCDWAVGRSGGAAVWGSRGGQRSSEWDADSSGPLHVCRVLELVTLS